MAKRRRRRDMSVKSMRQLARWNVEETLARGAPLVAVGAVYRLADGLRARLAFARDDEQRLGVGYAVERGEHWAIAELEPFSARALGYYQRRLKRIGLYERSLDAAEASKA
jgi:hypothetical protein